MIGLIKGTLTEMNGSQGLIITSGGVGYLVFITSRLVQGKTLPFELTLRTFLHVKDDALTLYGFENYQESVLFSHLLTVDGIGPKTAFAIISYAPSNQTIEAIRSQDLSYFTSISGLGKKTAQKLLLELSNKVGGSFELQSVILSKDDKIIIDALQSLGFSASEANKIIPELDHTKKIEEQIKDAIKKLTKI